MKRQSQKPASRFAIYILALVGVIAMMASLRTCSEKSPFSGTVSHPSGGDTIDVAIEYSPLSLYRYADTLGGFNYDLLRMMANNGKFTFKFHPVNSVASALEGLDAGRYDIIVADIPVTSDFMARYEYSEPVYLDRQVLVQKVDSQNMVYDQLQLAGRTVVVPKNSPAIVRLRNLAKEIGDTIIVKEDSIYGAEQLFILAALGEIPLAVVNEHVAHKLASDYSNVDVSTKISFTQFQSWLMRKADSLFIDSVNAELRMIKSTLEYRELTSRYFN